jgi:hypothetical protein
MNKCLSRLSRKARNVWLRLHADHLDTCADVERQKEIEARDNARYYQEQAMMVRSMIRV